MSATAATADIRLAATSAQSGPALYPLLVSMAHRRDAGAPASLAVVQSSVRPGEMPPLHVHHDDEAFQVLEGTLVVHVGREAIRVEAGEHVLAPAGVPHTYRAEGGRARFLATTFVRSAAHYEQFLRAVARPAASMGASWTTAEEAAVLDVLADGSGVTVLAGPGMLPAAA